MKVHLFKTVIAGLFIGLLFTSISAQNLLFQTMPKEKPQLGLRFMRPNFEGDDDLSILSGTYDLYFNIPVSPKLNLVGSLPFATFSFKGEDSESGIGNIYVGIQTRQMSGTGDNSSLSMGIFLPTAKDDFSLMFLGLYSNYYEIQKYIPDMLTVYGNYSYYKNQPRGAIFSVEIGPSLFIPTEDDGDVELFAHYGISAGFNLTNVTLSAELEGLAIISEDINDFEDRFTHSLTFGARWTRSNIRPGIYYQIYLKEDLRDDVDGVLGIKVDVDLK
jgi:hypothetical protein